MEQRSFLEVSSTSTRIKPEKPENDDDLLPEEKNPEAEIVPEEVGEDGDASKKSVIEQLAAGIGSASEE